MRFMSSLRQISGVCCLLLIVVACDSYTGPENPVVNPDPPPPQTVTTGSLELDEEFLFKTTGSLRIVVRLLDASSAASQQSRLEFYDISSGDQRELILAGFSQNARFERIVPIPSHIDSVLIRRVYAGIAVDSVKAGVSSLYGGVRILRHNFGPTAGTKTSKNTRQLYSEKHRYTMTDVDREPPAKQSHSAYQKGQVVFQDNMENGTNGWLHLALSASQTDNWQQTSERSASGQFSWRVSPHPSAGSDALQSPFINLTGIEDAILTFKQFYAFDDCGQADFAPDGGRVEISDGSGDWQVLKPVGGYPGVLDAICDNPLAGQEAYVQSSNGWRTAVFDLTPHANQIVYIRFRSAWDCDNCASDAPGWFIDDVAVLSAGADTDGDGIRDEDDDFPSSNTKAFQSWYPAENCFGTIACESDWPSKGDYDFNDLVMQYQYKLITDASGNVVALNGLFRVQAFSCAEQLGFGVRLPFSLSDIASFLGSSGTFLEASTGQAILVVSNDVSSLVTPAAGYTTVNTQEGSPYISAPVLSVLIEFNSPLPSTAFESTPFDPFFYYTAERIREVQMPDTPPVALPPYLGQQDDTSNPSLGRYYRTSKNMGWMLHVPSEWDHPLEGADLLKAFKRFRSWAESNGEEMENWYVSGSDRVNTEWVWRSP